MLSDALVRALRDAALVVVQAPAGYGKTTSVREAFAGQDDVAWYDAQPWEADAFVPALLARVRAVRPDAGRLTLALAEQGAEPERLGAALADELRHVDAPLRIVVDDAHVLGPSFAAFAGQLARRMPDAVRMVLLVRGAIDVGLPEAVAAGRGALVDANALRFDVPRLRALARSLGVLLDDARANALLQRTEGWPIALALALRAPDSSDVLLDELVSRRLDALEHADFVLLEATLAYETVEPEIAAPGDAEFAERLAALAADGSLVAPVAGGAFRVHPLVREALVRRVGEGALAVRHAAAARAYARAGRLRPALFHLDRAHDVEADVAFLREHAPAAVASGLTDGVRASLARVRADDADEPALVAFVDGLLAKARGDDGRAAFAEAAREADARGDGALAFRARLECVESDLAHGDPVSRERIDDLLARAAAQGPAAVGTALVRAGWADAVADDFAGALARLDTLAGDGAAVFGDVAPLEAYAHVALGDFEAAERVANALIETWSSSGDLARYAGALVWAARFALLRGETTAAYELAREGERVSRPFALRAQAAATHAALAEAALHVGDTALARREARAALRSADAAWYARDARRTRALATRILARADALDGDLQAALAPSVRDGTDADPLALADAATFAALAGAPDAAELREDARDAVAHATPVDGADAVALWSAAEVLDLLAALSGQDVETTVSTAPFDALIARRAESPRLASFAAILRAPARAKTHDPNPPGAHAADARARDAYDEAFARATRGGPRFETHVLARLAEPFLHGRGASAASRNEPALEQLTAREHEILELLAGGLTNREIAQRLVLSARTVETHVARITGKLGVGSRARAVARAVALGIVDLPAEAV